MNLPPAPGNYARDDQQNVRLQLVQADKENFKSGRDIRLQNGERIILKAPDGGVWALTVDNSGTLTTVAA